MLSIPKLPSEDEIRSLQEKRSQEMVLQIEKERQIAKEAFEKYELEGKSTQQILPPKNIPNASTFGSSLRTVDNWSGYTATAVAGAAASNIDPLIEQINIIKGYIKQARAAMRFEEVIEQLSSEQSSKFISNYYLILGCNIRIEFTRIAERILY